MRALIWALAVGAIGTGCRDGVPAFAPIEREPPTAAMYQVTFGYGQDADPRWTPGGDTLLYHTTLFGALPQVGGALLMVPRTGGTAVAMLGSLQFPGSRPFATPVLSPVGDRIAYIDMMSIDPPQLCWTGVDYPNECGWAQPLLDSAVLRVRSRAALNSPNLDPGIGVKFAGTDPGFRTAQPSPYLQRLFPFHEQYLRERVMVFRPSWSPDGQRVAFSDGLRILIWTPATNEVVPVPGTQDGVSAAWGPDGTIAFTRLTRQDSTSVLCTCPQGKDDMGYTTRVLYPTVTPTVELVRPDGSGLVSLGTGEDPAWSPDGEHVYMRSSNRIVRVPRQGGTAVDIPGTLGARAPAVSPDGRWLALMLPKAQQSLDYDIWVVSLVP